MPFNAKVKAVSRLVSRPGTRTDGASDMVARSKPVVTTASTSASVRTDVKKNQAWKYAGGNIERGHHLPGRYRDHHEGQTGMPRRKQESNFMVTINTNKAPSPERAEEAERRLCFVMSNLSDPKFMPAYFIFGPKHPEVYGNDRFEDVIANVNFKSDVETGPNAGRLHAHFLITVQHYSQIQMNVHMLAAETRRLFNGQARGTLRGLPFSLAPLPLKDELYISKKPYVHVKLMAQDGFAEIIKNYIHKGMSG